MNLYEFRKMRFTMDASLRELKKDLAEHREECRAASPKTCPYERKVNAEIDRQEKAVEHEDSLNADLAGYGGHGDDVSEATRILRNLIPGMRIVEHDTASEALDALPEDVRLSIPHVFTGTAADYEKPSLQFIGTGEGSQVYGWGLYGSNQRGVAETYATAALQDGDGLLFDGERIPHVSRYSPSSSFERATAAILNANGDMEIARENLEANAYDLFGGVNERGMEALKWFDENKHRYSEKKPAIYEQTFFTNRAPGDESHLLSWYEPLGKENFDRIVAQAEKEPFAKSFDKKQKSSKRFGFDENTPAGEVYNKLSTFYFRSPKAASEFMARADIDGVKYPVDSYGKQVKDGEEAGWNYVSFRDDNIRVDRKWVDGVEVPVGLKAQGGDIRLMAVTDLDGSEHRSETLGMSGEELAELDFRIVRLPNAPGMSTQQVFDWCRSNGVARRLGNDETNGNGIINVSSGSLREMLGGSQVAKSLSPEAHRAVVMNLHEVIGSAHVVENHPDRAKDKGVRSNDKIRDNGVSIDVMYVAVEVGGIPCRCKIRVKRYLDSSATDKAYSYDVKGIEVEPGRLEKVNDPFPRSSTSVAGGIILQGVEDWQGEKVLDRKNPSRQTWNETSDCRILGWYNRKTGDVHLVKGAATAKTVLHELGWHATFQWAEKNAPEMHRMMREYAENAPESVKDAVRKTYGGDISPEALLDEIGAERFTQDHAEKFERRVRSNLEASRSWWGRVKSGVRDTWERLVDRANGLTKRGGRINVSMISRMNPSDGMSALYDLMSRGRTLGGVAHDEAILAARMLGGHLSQYLKLSSSHFIPNLL